jgi:hypothetical protein
MDRMLELFIGEDYELRSFTTCDGVTSNILLPTSYEPEFISGSLSSTTELPYSPISTGDLDMIYEDDGENDWPVIRYADVLLMLAEAQGFIAPNSSSVQLINQIRTRVGLASVNPQTVDEFYKYLSRERRFEFAFENQRWFDLLRFKTTTTTLDPIAVIQNHFSNMYSTYYSQYPQPLSLTDLQSMVTPEKLLLPIPQREIDINTTIVIPQNPGY